MHFTAGQSKATNAPSHNVASRSFTRGVSSNHPLSHSLAGRGLLSNQEGLLQRKCACGGTPGVDGLCAECRSKRLQADPFPAPPIVDDVLRSPGQPLDPSTRAVLEPRFGHDFSQVRVHTDAKAAESARGVNALAYTVGQDVVFETGEYRPTTDAGRRLLTHELSHTVQQGSLVKQPPGMLTTTNRLDSVEQEAERAAYALVGAQPFTVTTGHTAQIARNTPDAGPSPIDAGPSPIDAGPADRVRSAMRKKDPIAGYGDPEAFRILDSLPTMAELLDTLNQLAPSGDLDTLLGHAVGRNDRIHMAMLVVQFRAKGPVLTPEEIQQVRNGYASLLTASERDEVRSFLVPIGELQATHLLLREEEEVERLAKLQRDFWEEKRKKQEEEAKKAAEEAAKKAGTPAPTTTPKVNVDTVLQEEVKKRGFPTTPTDAWTKLPKSVQNDWKNNRAPAAWNKVLASVKGTELEKVLAGKTFGFLPEEALKEYFYARQNGTTLEFGMSFVENVEGDPKNVWPIIAHEMGGHFEYGPTYAEKIIKKAIDMLPEPERTKWRQPDNWNKVFLAYQYSETEIFAALRQRRYSDPVSGKKPVYGAIDPETNITNHLNKIKDGFPVEVGKAILIELKQKIDASTEILDRDKKYFADKVKAILGYTL